MAAEESPFTPGLVNNTRPLTAPTASAHEAETGGDFPPTPDPDRPGSAAFDRTKTAAAYQAYRQARRLRMVMKEKERFAERMRAVPLAPPGRGAAIGGGAARAPDHLAVAVVADPGAADPGRDRDRQAFNAAADFGFGAAAAEPAVSGRNLRAALDNYDRQLPLRAALSHFDRQLPLRRGKEAPGPRGREASHWQRHQRRSWTPQRKSRVQPAWFRQGTFIDSVCGLLVAASAGVGRHVDLLSVDESKIGKRRDAARGARRQDTDARGFSEVRRFGSRR